MLKRQFEEAAERLRVKRKLEQLPPGERIIERLKIYMKEWRDDLDARPAHAVNTTVGLQVRCHHLCAYYVILCGSATMQGCSVP